MTDCARSYAYYIYEAVLVCKWGTDEESAQPGFQVSLCV